MRTAKKQLVGVLAIASLLWAESAFTLVSARATTPDIPLLRLSQLQPWRQAYQCGNFAVTLSQQGRDRYTYEAINDRGATLVIRNGTQASGRNYSSLYRFTNNGSDYVLEDFGGGKAALSISQYPNKGTTFNCTTDGTAGNPNPGNPSPPTPQPVAWSHTYQCGEYRVTLRDLGRNKYSYQTQDLYLDNGDRTNTGRSWVYAFYNNDYTYRLEDAWGGGVATLNVARYGQTMLTRGCRK